jgi:hypothetical protein
MKVRYISTLAFGTLVACLSLAAPPRASAAERYALIVSGAAGGENYAQDYAKWRAALVESLKTRRVPAEHITVLAESAEAPGDRATRENVRRVLAALKAKVAPEDVLLIVLIGHGTYDGNIAKFNLVGPDIDSAEWGSLLQGTSSRLVLVNTTGSSFPFLAELSGRNRVIVTATDSAAQRFDTVFPQYFVEALEMEAADLDKNSRISVWEAFSYASTAVRQYYEQRGQLSTERPLIDDNGDKVGKEAGAPGPDGAIARATYLDADQVPAAGADPALVALQRRKAALELEIEDMKAKKGGMPLEEYEQQLEKLLVELARIDKEIRSKSPGA